jgi:cytochrome oxidase Cu insertion factor (SCO1/SenC/PrrC family)
MKTRSARVTARALLVGSVDSMSDVVHLGAPAPDFALPAHDGTTVRLADLRGHWVVLWWYPKAATPG